MEIGASWEMVWDRRPTTRYMTTPLEQFTVPKVSRGIERILEAARGQNSIDGNSSATTINHGRYNQLTFGGGVKKNWGLTKTPIILESPVYTHNVCPDGLNQGGRRYFCWRERCGGVEPVVMPEVTLGQHLDGIFLSRCAACHV